MRCGGDRHAGRPARQLYEDVLADVGARRRITAKTLSQRHYVELIREHDVVFAIGPAGTGKTYLADRRGRRVAARREVTRS